MDTATAVEAGRRRRQLALVVLCLCALTTGLDMTVVNLALPFISRELHASISELQWVIDSYNIVIAGLLVLGGGLADRYGRKLVFLSGYALFGAACLFVFPGLGIPVQTFAVVGMAAFFTGVVRAPLTGIVLITEMTGAFTVLLPMLAACCAAMLVPTLLRNMPIYESLRAGTLRRERALRKK